MDTPVHAPRPVTRATIDAGDVQETEERKTKLTAWIRKHALHTQTERLDYSYKFITTCECCVN